MNNKTINMQDLWSYCNKYNRFTGGSVETYDKLFVLNENGASIDVLAGVIFANSNVESFTDYGTIKEELEQIKIK